MCDSDCVSVCNHPHAVMCSLQEKAGDDGNDDDDNDDDNTMIAPTVSANLGLNSLQCDRLIFG